MVVQMKIGKLLISNIPYPFFNKEGYKSIVALLQSNSNLFFEKIHFVIPTFLKGGKGGLMI
jgi:hypothetical protein